MTERSTFTASGIAILVFVLALASLAPAFAQDDVDESPLFGDDDECVIYQVGGASAVDDVDEDETEGDDVAITGDPLEIASSAALAYTGEGTVTDTEIGDEEGFYEIEITLADGSQVDVHLDEDFNFLSDEIDGADDVEDIEAETVDDDDDGDVTDVESCGLLEAATLTLDEIIDLAETETGSTVVLVELENEDGLLVYEAEVADGVEIEFDAATGDILEIEQAD